MGAGEGGLVNLHFVSGKKDEVTSASQSGSEVRGKEHKTGRTTGKLVTILPEKPSSTGGAQFAGCEQR